MSKTRLVIFKGKGGFYWRLVAGNGKKTAIGGEPFATEGSAIRGFRTVKRILLRTTMHGIPIVRPSRKRRRR